MGSFDTDVKKGIAARLDRATLELKDLEEKLKLLRADVDPRLLTDFREAIDHVRLTAWAVQSWVEQRTQGHSPATLLPLLTLERIRRATRLCTDLTDDLTQLQEIARSSEKEKLEPLSAAVTAMQACLEKLGSKR